MEAPRDARAVFLLPWKNHSLLGTTENVYRGDPAQVAVLDSEQQYLLEVLEHYFPGHSGKVIGRFAGLRVLPANGHNAFSRSRETHLATDHPQRPRQNHHHRPRKAATYQRRTALCIVAPFFSKYDLYHTPLRVQAVIIVINR